MGDLNTNHKKPIITLIIIALVVFAGGTAGLLQGLKNGEDKPGQKLAAASTSADKPAVKATEATTVEFVAVKDKTVLEQLQSKATVEVKDSQYGPYVDSVNSIKGGTDNKYWSYYVDGQMANIGAGEYVTKGGETITWKFE